MSEVMHKMIGMLKGGGMHTALNVLEDPTIMNKINGGQATAKEAAPVKEAPEKAQHGGADLATHSSAHVGVVQAKSKL